MLYDVNGNVINPMEGMINVKDYGAVGDGTTDDTTAIQSALDAVDTLGGGLVFFPTGSYIISSALLIKCSNIHIDFNGSTLIHDANETFNCMMRNYCEGGSGYTGIKNVIVENGTFDGNGYTSSMTQLGFIHGSNIVTRNCRFIGTENTNTTWHHIEYNAVKYGIIENCYFEGKRGIAYEMIQLGDAYGSLGWPWDSPTWDDVGCDITEIKGCHFVDNGHATCVGWHGTTAPTHINVHDCTAEDCATIVGVTAGVSHDNVSIATT